MDSPLKSAVWAAAEAARANAKATANMPLPKQSLWRHLYGIIAFSESRDGFIGGCYPHSGAAGRVCRIAGRRRNRRRYCSRARPAARQAIADMAPSARVITRMSAIEEALDPVTG